MSSCRSTTLPAVACVFALACGGERGPVEADTVALVPADTLVTTASELIGGVYDLAISPAGTLYLSDYGFKHVLGLDPASGDTVVVGRAGSGPGEFEMPWIVAAADDSVRVLDAESNLVQVFGPDRGLARSYRVETPSFGGGRAFRDDGVLAATTAGHEDALAVILDPSGERVATIGAPIVPAIAVYDFAAIKAEIREGRVPAAFRNEALPAWGEEDDLYLAFTAEPELRRYDADGDVLWARGFREPVMEATRERFMRRNIEEQSPARLHPLRYFRDIQVVEGDVWLLVDTDDEAEGLLLVLDGGDGSLRRRITFPGLPNTGPFVVDPQRRALYMAPREEASLLRFVLPEA